MRPGIKINDRPRRSVFRDNSVTANNVNGNRMKMVSNGYSRMSPDVYRQITGSANLASYDGDRG